MEINHTHHGKVQSVQCSMRLTLASTTWKPMIVATAGAASQRDSISSSRYGSGAIFAVMVGVLTG